jgi:c-di-GMP-binding flagellar brake protein YcgR
MINFAPFLRNRRFDARIPLEMHVSTFVRDQPKRALTLDISESGLYLNSLPQDPLPPRTPVGLEIDLPGFGETIWVAGETCRDTLDDYFYGFGVRFMDMANLHQRMLRAYCLGARRRLGYRTLRS